MYFNDQFKWRKDSIYNIFNIIILLPKCFPQCLILFFKLSITFIELKRMIQCVSLVNDDTNLKKFFENREYI